MEEKIDGANVGFSMDENGKILCQNRSHYVDSKYHFQFQSLGSFIFQKRESLERILQSGRILYGEWMYAKHSIHYTNLPDIFIAFDIFDPKEQKFLDRATFREIMASTNIAHVQPLVTDPESYTTREALETLLKNTKSKFSDSIIEGIYFRWDQNGKLRTRAKLVRSDFIAGDEHWSKGKITLNSLSSS
jgi:atypical dual specificity phosphatase